MGIEEKIRQPLAERQAIVQAGLKSDDVIIVDGGWDKQRGNDPTGELGGYDPAGSFTEFTFKNGNKIRIYFDELYPDNYEAVKKELRFKQMLQRLKKDDDRALPRLESANNDWDMPGTMAETYHALHDSDAGQKYGFKGTE